MTSAYTKENVAILRDFMKRALRDEKGVVPVLTSTLKEVFDYIEALEQDAARYQLIRNGVGCDVLSREEYLFGEELDNAIDMVARQAKGKEAV